MMRRRRFLLSAAGAFAALVAPKLVRAHGGHLHAPALYVRATRRSTDGRVIEIDLEIFNGFGVAATLRGLTASVGDRLLIERRRDVFGRTLWQPVSFLRLEPDEALALEAPDYRIRISDVDEPADETVQFQLEAEFGALGALWTSTLAGPAPAEDQMTE